MASLSTSLRWTFLLLLPVLGGTQLACKGTPLNLLSLDDDIELGRSVEAEIAANPQEYPLLPEAGNEEVYLYIRGMADKILNSGQVRYKDRFPWTVRIVHKDDVVNAFAAPGGFIYVYTGLIKFLDTEDQLAGVMGHEIAHADLRHSSRQLTRMLGISLIAEALLGQNAELLKQVTTTLLALSFSREHETESDLASVKYLCPTDWNAAGSAGFFRKIEDQPSPPQFLSTHPNPANRVKNIEDEKTKLGCSGEETYLTRYNQIKDLLP
jgi:beta-barrel assembly-enhancing protease